MHKRLVAEPGGEKLRTSPQLAVLRVAAAANRTHR